MEGFIDNAKKFLATDQGKNVESQFENSTGIDVDKYLGSSGGQGQAPNATGDPQTQDSSTQPPGSVDAYGNPGEAGQYGQEGQYGAVTGKGFGGGFNQNQNQNQSDQEGSADAYGNQGQSGQFGQEGQYGAVTGKGFGGDLAKDNSGAQGQGQKKSDYEGMDAYDSTASGGYGKNAAGGAFSRQNQMGADQQGEAGFADDKSDDGYGGGYKTGTSTPGYRQDGDVDAEAAENRIRNQNVNTYGQQSDDRGSSGNDYNEAI